ncbi:FtsX-like permease family protein [Myceligenerans crystallogenes]|uniref:ABC3 transporter permease C-terminal domain-containing protein n=1 Tax=Myceligenerans crystallogenes TaxID=316335 RepID=A0ABP4ZWG8_9MICO
MSGAIARAVAHRRLGMRLARRDARRHLGRTVLVVLMVALTVGAGSFVVTALASNEVYGPGDIEAELGPELQAKIEGVGGRVAQEPPAVDGRMGRESSGPRSTSYTELERSISAALPDGTRMSRMLEGEVLIHREGVPIRNAAVQADLQDPAVAARFPLFDGRYPAAGSEVMVTSYQARLGYEIGDTIEVEVAGDLSPATIVGVTGLIRDAQEDTAVLFGEPGPLTPPREVERRSSDHPLWYVSGDSPVTWSDVEALNDAGAFVTSRHVLGTMTGHDDESGVLGSDPRLDRETLAVTVAMIIVGVLEAIWLIGPAFAIGARRDTRSLALLAVNGAPASALRTVMLARAVLAGAIGAVVGVGLGIAATLLLIAVAPGTVSVLEIPWAGVAVLALIGVGLAVAAAWPPARRAANADVAEVLSGRRPAGAASPVPTVIGSVAAVGGICLAVASGLAHQVIGISAGIVVTALGLVLACGGIVGLLGRFAVRAPWTWRFALRDASRQRGRTVPAIAAVIVAVAVAATALTTFAGSRASMLRGNIPQAAEGALVMKAAGFGQVIDEDAAAKLSDVVARSFPDAGPMIPVRIPVNSDGLSISVYVHEAQRLNFYGDESPATKLTVTDGDDPGLLRALGVPERHHAAIRTALSQGRVVAPRHHVFEDGTIRVNIGRYDERDGIMVDAGGPTGVPLPATAIGDVGEVVGNLPLIPPSLIGELGATGTGVGAYIAMADIPSDLANAQGALLLQHLAAAGLRPDGEDATVKADDVHIGATVEGSHIPADNGWFTILVIAAAALFLALTGTWSAVALSAIDSRPDLAALAAIGATPSARKRVVAAQAGAISVTGTLLGVLAGIPLGLAFELNSDLPLVVPWGQVALLVLAVPVLAISAAWLVTRSRVPLTRRRG